jgi:hypothetical protein
MIGILLMLKRISYFRVKFRRLPEIAGDLSGIDSGPAGFCSLSTALLKWPVTRVQDRHYFQFGGYGGVEPEEYLAPEIMKDIGQQFESASIKPNQSL